MIDKMKRLRSIAAKIGYQRPTEMLRHDVMPPSLTVTPKEYALAVAEQDSAVSAPGSS